MRDPERIGKILGTIEKLWQASPDLRLCQLIENIVPTETICKFCMGVGYKNLPSEKPMVINLEVCLRCNATGRHSVSNYNLEDSELLENLEKEIERRGL